MRQTLASGNVPRFSSCHDSQVYFAGKLTTYKSDGNADLYLEGVALVATTTTATAAAAIEHHVVVVVFVLLVIIRTLQVEVVLCGAECSKGPGDANKKGGPNKGER